MQPGFNSALSCNGSSLTNALTRLAHLHGKSASIEDLTAGLPHVKGELPINLVPRALARVGLESKLYQTVSIDKVPLPACALLKNGEYIVITQVHDDEYVLAAPFIKDAGTRVPVEEVELELEGTLITALPKLEDIQRRHIGEEPEKHWFWGRFSKQRKIVTDVVLGSIVANIFAVAVSLFALQVYDRVIPNQSITTLWVLVAGCAVAIILEAVLRMSRSYLIDYSGRSIELEISSTLLEKLNGMRLSSRPASPGSLVHMVREFGSVREFFTSTSIGTSADIPFTLIFLTLIYAIAGSVVWIVVAAMVLIVTPSLLAQKKMLALSVEMQGGTAAAGKLLTELTYNHELVKANRAENMFQHKWEEINQLNATKTSEQRALAAMLTYWATAIQQVAYVATVVAGVYLVFTGDFTVGTIIALSILCSRALAPVTQLAGTLARWQQVRSGMSALEEIMCSEQERDKDREYVKKETISGDITLSNLSYSHTAESPAFLKIDNLSLKHRTTVAVLGENGSGKSTLLKVLSGLYTPDEGSINIDNLEMRQIDPVDIRRNLGYLPQEVKLFSGTLRDNLLLGAASKDDDSIAEALQFSGLNKLIERSPAGLDMEIADGGEGMSVGQRQSLGLARLYLQDPPIVLLDEPTASLDQALEMRLVKQLEHWLQGRTCVIATHRLPILSVASRIIVMSNGHIKMDGATEDIIEQLTVKPLSNEAA